MDRHPALQGVHSVQLRGKSRLLLIGVVVAALIGAVAAVSAKAARPDKQAATATPGSNINGGTSASADEVQRLKSYGLLYNEVPPGSQLRVAEEFRNYAAAATTGSTKDEATIAKQGRIDGFYQVWIQTSSQYQYQARFDLYNKPDSAKAILETVRKSNTSQDVQNMDDPKLGDGSHMYEFTSQQAGQKYEGWAVQWVRGRTLFDVNGLGPVGSLHSDDVLNAARQVDLRAQQSPIK
jgi:hypothetical protein